MQKATAVAIPPEEKESRRLARLVVLGAFVRGELSPSNELTALGATWDQVA